MSPLNPYASPPPLADDSRPVQLSYNTEDGVHFDIHIRIPRPSEIVRNVKMTLKHLVNGVRNRCATLAHRGCVCVCVCMCVCGGLGICPTALVREDGCVVDADVRCLGGWVDGWVGGWGGALVGAHHALLK